MIKSAQDGEKLCPARFFFISLHFLNGKYGILVATALPSAERKTDLFPLYKKEAL